MKKVLSLFLLLILISCVGNPAHAQITGEDLDKAFADYKVLVDVPQPDTQYRMYKNVDHDWWVQYQDSLFYASEWIAVVPVDNPYVQTLDNNDAFEYLTTISIPADSKVTIREFMLYYDQNRKYSP